MTTSSAVPSPYADAATDHPLVADWVARAAAGEAATLLVLAPPLSGKTHMVWAAYRRLEAAGVPVSDISVRDEYRTEGGGLPDIRRTLMHRVVMVDPADCFDPERFDDPEGVPNYQPRPEAEQEVEEPWYQAERAICAGDLRNLVSKLTFSATHAALLTATSGRTLERAFDEALADRILAWPTVTLPKRAHNILTW